MIRTVYFTYNGYRRTMRHSAAGPAFAPSEAMGNLQGARTETKDEGSIGVRDTPVRQPQFLNWNRCHTKATFSCSLIGEPWLSSVHALPSPRPSPFSSGPHYDC